MLELGVGGAGVSATADNKERLDVREEMLHEVS